MLKLRFHCYYPIKYHCCCSLIVFYYQNLLKFKGFNMLSATAPYFVDQIILNSSIIVKWSHEPYNRSSEKSSVSVSIYSSDLFRSTVCIDEKSWNTWRTCRQYLYICCDGQNEFSFIKVISIKHTHDLLKYSPLLTVRDFYLEVFFFYKQIDMMSNEHYVIVIVNFHFMTNIECF